MADAKISALTELASNPAVDDFIPILDTSTGSTKKISAANLAQRSLQGSVSNPQAVYAQRPQIFMYQAPWAMTVTKIHISNPTTDDIVGDLKFADDTLTGVFAGATVIDICDSTSGSFTVSASSDMDDATVPANKYIYFSLDSSPAAAVKDFFIRIDYTVD
jgi:hypothetical protein